METTIDDEAERYLRQLSAEWVRPEQGECLTCFVERMLHRSGCDITLRFALFFRDQRVPRAASLERTLGEAGGYCDCEVLMNAPVRRGAPGCRRVPPGSIHPCANWQERPGSDDDEEDGWEDEHDDGW